MEQAHPPRQIVLAEDNPADVRLVREVLSEHRIDCDLHVVKDGEEAFAFISKLDLDTRLPCPDLVLLDLHLPKRDGEQVLRHIRASERCGLTPVVILTSSDSPGDRENAEKNAVLHYFRKPSSLTRFMDLGVIIKEVVGRPRPA